MFNDKKIADLLAGKLGSSEKSFGLVMAVFFAALAVAPRVLEQGSVAWSRLALSNVFLVLALWAPSLLRPLNIAWTTLGLVLHFFISPVVMALLYFGVFTPVGLLMRLAGRDPLARRWNSTASTYWIERTHNHPTSESMRLQF